MIVIVFGRKQRSATSNVYGDITPKSNKLLIGYCSICNSQKSMTVTDNNIVAEGLGDLFTGRGKKGLNAPKMIAQVVFKILEELWKLGLSLALHLHLETRKQLYHHYVN